MIRRIYLDNKVNFLLSGIKRLAIHTRRFPKNPDPTSMANRIGDNMVIKRKVIIDRMGSVTREPGFDQNDQIRGILGDKVSHIGLETLPGSSSAVPNQDLQLEVTREETIDHSPREDNRGTIPSPNIN